MEEIKYKVYYKKIKSSLITIEPDGEVIIKVPLGTGENEIDDIVRRKSKWIRSKKELLESRKKLNCDEIMYLGEIYKLNIIIQPYLKMEFVIDHNKTFIINTISKERGNKVLEKYLREKCKEVVYKKVDKYRKYFPSEPKEVKVKEQKKRWGSCTYDNRIFLNWKLIMGRELALEYVVVHEMCHMVHKNHSKQYWELVGKIMSSYKEEHNWLKDNGYLMNV
ncbi:M48 family metallopeptidase [Clostridium cibarium]|uniref:M48 family metallopeptidase n=1 Tax=Clostridium cibarium TaxID=2762247 RepID=A0ABR8PYT7_9CLOT|nr:SprT family zinc-dependent metalloprotease [Clostridium cibarium]MBD7913323.1 M48 family metallopeptidase [Clostridium cibarium]